MPETRKQRRERERRQNEQRQLMDDAVANPPAHIKARLSSASPLAENIQSGLSRYGWHGHRYTPEGQESREKPLGAEGADARRREADERCRTLRDKYEAWWGNKKRIRHIAEREEISERTVRRYFERCPK